ncbi:ectoine/hydroxyectoine ABC transporter permease subunit EhuC [Chromobacterium phragmitis]|uniref:Ectoine/hydroxyectoine ABC transporter permease subunit EhuC n=1 Tax=Chromobacterium phragmitis TaxID=2202141 RepID=A0A344UHU5_9NEIS|nr:ectoine/hydroxyectoine ABC transporter permease subunit EhuC [Chromobacterium phragmitis]AXE34843.1 ectoine/hydroxyectoine ABC transporter permease subunit EhuC [Chromobacterium phragmitis]
MWDIVSALLGGAWVTAQLAIGSTVLGAALSFGFGLGRLSRHAAARMLSLVYIEVFRGTSLLVQLFWIFFALPLLGLTLAPMAAGVFALALNIGAYGAEVVRGAVQAVPKSQHEAARALNFKPRQAMWHIALPQALPEMLPSFGNLAVQNLKDTALVSLITLGDLAFRAESLRNFTQQSTEIYSLTLLIYFGMALLLAALFKRMERRLGRWKARRAG